MRTDVAITLAKPPARWCTTARRCEGQKFKMVTLLDSVPPGEQAATQDVLLSEGELHGQ
ncbi:hypothetical protein AB0L86_25185 [Micromonospora musae]|uniref:hypothetical protein n=1 Tax=Micromonospora musae TaxID=1894970 RepID=UPI0034153578